ncbi:uncharacterized protein LOC119582243 [Penaeus monodon]|uniref:uncharacterized protein LOC119582243 n=1 Tax=Penaeus monodon TaxID=6687 RepID=UPI0018A74F70|nr:uncharacterized protein LOC119582243 [Penaeus monodon]
MRSTKKLKKYKQKKRANITYQVPSYKSSVRISKPSYQQTFIVVESNCFLTLQTSPGSATLTVAAFDLGAGDEVLIQNPYTHPLQLNGSIASGTEYRIPSLLFVASFVSDGSLTNSGFSLSFQLSSTGCLKSKIALDTKQVLTSPRYSRAYVRAGTYCEYRIAVLVEVDVEVEVLVEVELDVEVVVEVVVQAGSSMKVKFAVHPGMKFSLDLK